RLAEDLEAVADPPDQAALRGELQNPLHDRAEARDGPRAQVVAVAEAPGQDDAVDAVQVWVLVPEVRHLRVQHVLDHPPAVAVGPGPGKHDDPEFHGAPHPTRATHASPLHLLTVSARRGEARLVLAR